MQQGESVRAYSGGVVDHREPWDPFDRLIEIGERTLAAIDDLNASVQALVTEQAAVDKAVQDLVAAVQNSAASNDPAIEAAVAQIQAVTAQQTADAAQDPTP